MVFCSNKANQLSGNAMSISGSQGAEIEVKFVDSMQGFEAEWSSYANPHSIFCHSDYLIALEKAPPLGVQLGYLVFEQNGEAIGSAILQVQYFKANQNIRYNDEEPAGFFGTMGRFFRNLVASRVEFYTLVCGSILLTGEHGFYFKPGLFDQAKQLAILDEGLSFAQKAYEEKGIAVAGNLIKDFYIDNAEFARNLIPLGYHEFQVQPNMVLHQPNIWENLDAYLSSLTSKYRVRYRRARKKSADLIKKELSVADIELHKSNMFRLYNAVADNSGFNLVNLNEDYLLALKKELGDRFKITGYFNGDQLLGYYSTIKDYDALEAHYLGFEKSANGSHQIYLNMLYDILEEAIECKAKEIVYARTAMEIKSSVGAKGIDMVCYLKHSNAITNKMLPSILTVLKPEKDWVPRNPFKA